MALTNFKTLSNDVLGFSGRVYFANNGAGNYTYIWERTPTSFEIIRVKDSVEIANPTAKIYTDYGIPIPKYAKPLRHQEGFFPDWKYYRLGKPYKTLEAAKLAYIMLLTAHGRN